MWSAPPKTKGETPKKKGKKKNPKRKKLEKGKKTWKIGLPEPRITQGPGPKGTPKNPGDNPPKLSGKKGS